MVSVLIGNPSHLRRSYDARLEKFIVRAVSSDRITMQASNSFDRFGTDLRRELVNRHLGPGTPLVDPQGESRK